MWSHPDGGAQKEGDHVSKHAKKKSATKIDTTAGTDTAIAAEPAPASEKKPKKGGKEKSAKRAAPVADTAGDQKPNPSVGGPTLADVSKGYLGHMDSAGKSSGTIASYAAELRVANVELGADTL